jgi:hypothetical protein
VAWEKVAELASCVILVGTGLFIYFTHYFDRKIGTKKLLILLLCCGLALICLAMFFFGWLATWEWYHLPAFPLPFLDLRLITGSAQSLAAGFDPTIENPFDPNNRLFNYPKIWFVILASGINLNWTIPLGLILTGIFIGAVIFFPASLNRFSSVLIALVFFSPVVMLGIERGNVDLLFFFFMALTLLLADKKPVAALVTFLLSVIFKIFPIFGIGAFLGRDGKRSLPYLLLGGGASIIYFILIINDMVRVFTTTQKGNDQSYGVTVIQQAFTHALQIGLNPDKIILYAFAFVLLAFTVFFGIRNRVQADEGTPGNLKAFWVGAGIYVGTFLLGNNWDYRLIFILFAIPQLSDWLRSKTKWTTIISVSALACILLIVWSYMWRQPLEDVQWLSKVGYLMEQACTWILFFGLSYLIVHSLPEWVFNIHKYFRKNKASGDEGI